MIVGGCQPAICCARLLHPSTPSSTFSRPSADRDTWQKSGSSVCVAAVFLQQRTTPACHHARNDQSGYKMRPSTSTTPSLRRQRRYSCRPGGNVASMIDGCGETNFFRREIVPGRIDQKRHLPPTRFAVLVFAASSASQRYGREIEPAAAPSAAGAVCGSQVAAVWRVLVDVVTPLPSPDAQFQVERWFFSCTSSVDRNISLLDFGRQAAERHPAADRPS